MTKTAPYNVAAYTAFSGYQTYPPYISINVRREGFVDIHIRSSESMQSKEASIEMAQADFEQLIDRAVTQPYLGLATTAQLIEELRARCESNGTLDYRTADEKA